MTELAKKAVKLKHWRWKIGQPVIALDGTDIDGVELAAFGGVVSGVGIWRDHDGNGHHDWVQVTDDESETWTVYPGDGHDLPDAVDSMMWDVELLPDFTGHLGCLVQVVREAWSDDTVSAQVYEFYSPHSGKVRKVGVNVRNEDGTRYQHCADTEAGSLVAALAAAE